ncbi:protein translocase subunit SecD [Paenactinomyces guangxiensis]|uniref:Protein translocase subunit SecD n=1 Tax=Paenactinomyces guangxiensis TaxID=1490290 RepID=A0A7W1WTF5_9BACL|nr:protein translocase subunit SecD [Paenactinomyces guangxiensis]MBA4495745.1 protein translocase subunit SecD [Paenactinomyces guangxiensis]MBH8592734.1 protein translocase subunit SecD [Paenactinomyces guangxiensis]
MKLRKGKLTIFILLVVAILGTAATTTGKIWNNITKGLDLQGGFEVLYQAKKGQKVNAQILHDAASAIRNRVDVIGVTEPEITVEEPNRIRVQLAGVKDQAEARRLLGKPAKLTFRDPTGKKVLIDGKDLKEHGAKVDYDPQTNQPLVTLQMKNPKKLEDVTRKYLGQPMPIYLDETQLSAPVIQTVITGGNAQIDGQRSVEEAQKLVDLLNAGAIPIELEEVQSFAVDASLGAASMKDSLIAGVYAILAIFIFVIGYYRLPGMIATVTLIAYSYLVLLTFMLLDVTLTLPGIAAFILGIGMAVDANIIMNERIREELRIGKSVPAAMRSGSRRSFWTIFDANITTIIAAGVLFFYGTAAVKGFSVSLIVSIIVSFIAAVGLSRILMNLLIRSNLLKHPGLFGVREDEISDL